MSAQTPGQAAVPPKWTGKFRKLPVVIEAVQLTRENAAEVWRWVTPAVKVGQAVDVTIDIDKGLTVSTLEGDMRAPFGWWIVKGVKGEFYPCDPDVFAASYESADAAQERPAPTPGRAAEALRLAIEARIALWRQVGETSEDLDGLAADARDAVRTCAHELAEDLTTWREQARDFAAREPRPAPGLTESPERAWGRRTQAAGTAPELAVTAAKLRETVDGNIRLRELVAEILAVFGQHRCDDPACESIATIPTARLTKWRKRAGLED